MGACIPLVLGLAAAFPKRKVIAFDSDGSLMVDSSSLITVADVSPANFEVSRLVMDNGSYGARRRPSTSRRKNLSGKKSPYRSFCRHIGLCDVNVLSLMTAS